jgi:signal transduction histidine kinase
VLVLMRDVGDAPFGDEDYDLAVSFATQVAVSLVVADVRREGERLAVYEERDRIARDLHDLVIQRLFATGMILQGTGRVVDVPKAVSDRVNRAIDELDETVKEIRHTIFALHEPRDGSGSGVRSRLMAEVEQAKELLGFGPAIRFAGPVDAMVPAEMEGDLIAVLREGLANAAKHAQASRVDVLCTASGGELKLVVSDNGQGLVHGGRMSGVANIRNRALKHGGDCTWEAIPSGGTRMVWKAPLA